jgi:Na+-translocating ferredoxin:NAD+ oxidoreductase subunit C
MSFLSADTTALPCIRCGDCIVACPESLNPQALMLAIKTDDWPSVSSLKLEHCAECGRCDVACPSRINLSALFGTAKQQRQHHIMTSVKRDAARKHFENRNLRLQRLAVEKEQRHDQRKQNATSADAVAQALARAKAKRMQAKGDTHE